MKLKHIAVAVAMAAAGTANAAIDGGGVSGNGSMFLVVYDRLASGSFATTAGIFDLGFAINDIIGAAGNGINNVPGQYQNSYIQWDFLHNTVNIDGVMTNIGTNDWTSAFNTMVANTDNADRLFFVGANDAVGTASNLRYLATGSTTADGAIQSSSATTGFRVFADGKTSDVFTPLSGKGTINAVDNGAYTFTSADGAASRANGYVVAGDAMANNWGNANLLGGTVSDTQQNGLWALDARNSLPASGQITTARLIGTVDLNLAAGTLTYNTANAPVAAVPEPSSYALVIAGLAVLGVFARRRRAA